MAPVLEPKTGPRFGQKVGPKSANFVPGGAPFSGPCLLPLPLRGHGVFGTQAAVDAAMSRARRRREARPALAGRSVRRRGGMHENYYKQTWTGPGGFRGGGRLSRGRGAQSFYTWALQCVARKRGGGKTFVSEVARVRADLRYPRARAAGGSAFARGKGRQAERGNARKLLHTKLEGFRRI